MSHAQVRIANGRDLSGLLALYRELRPNDPILTQPEAERIFSLMLDDPNVSVIVAAVDTAIASTCMLAVVPNLAHGGRPFGVIEHVVTTRTHRRKGLARGVIEFALNLAWSRQCYKVMLLSGFERN